MVETQLVAVEKHLEAEVDNYETDLISFLSAHKMLALQILLVVIAPIAFAAFEIGKHWHGST